MPGVNAASTVETFIALKLFIETWRWAGVPIYIRAGKMLPVTATEVFVEFKRPPMETFGEIVPGTSAHLRMRISPDIAIGMGVRVKTPGEQMTGSDVELTLTEQAAADTPPYERLLGDAMRGLTELFTRQDVVEAQWRAVDPILGNVTPVSYTHLGFEIRSDLFILNNMAEEWDCVPPDFRNHSNNGKIVVSLCNRRYF